MNILGLKCEINLNRIEKLNKKNILCVQKFSWYFNFKNIILYQELIKFKMNYTITVGKLTVSPNKILPFIFSE